MNEIVRVGVKPAVPVKIMGANEVQNENPEIHTAHHDGGVEVRAYEETVVASDAIRSAPQKPGDPEVRVRDSSISKAEWEAIKRGDD